MELGDPTEPAFRETIAEWLREYPQHRKKLLREARAIVRDWCRAGARPEWGSGARQLGG